MDKLLTDLPWLHYKLANVEIWLWLVLPLLFVGSYILAKLLISLLSLFSNTLKLGKRAWWKRYVFSVTEPLSLLLAAMIFSITQKILPLTDKATVQLNNFNSTLYTIAITWIILIYVNHTCELLRARLMNEGRGTSSAMIPLFRKIADATILVLSLLFLMQNWGFDVAALIAALGIGGIAVALASQKSVESLFGGIIISLDQPIRVGETGKFGDVTGTVEDIGLRSTRIRTDKRTLYYIPNADMAAMRIENLSVREKLLFQKTLPLALDTLPAQVEKILDDVRSLLKMHALVDGPGARAQLVNLGPASADIEITAYVKTKVWDEYLNTQEELLLKIMHIVETAGARLAQPPQPKA